MIEREPSEQTLRACDGHRQALADVKGTTRNAVDQLLAGNTHDPYVAFRKLFQEAAWAGADIEHCGEPKLRGEDAADRSDTGVLRNDE